MKWFKKEKEKKVESPLPKPCNHKWKDFPWYSESTYDHYTNQIIISIIEPYVCIHCKQRKDIELNTIIRNNVSLEEATKLKTEIEENYKDKLMDKTYIEDMIHDMQLVDREYLKIAETLKIHN